MKKTRLLAFLLTACLATTCFLSGTVAKYSSTAAGEDSARVAKWSFNVGKEGATENITTQNTFTFDLFETVNDSYSSTDNDEEVLDATGASAKGIIAPGTSGSFDIVLTNTSEVDVQYAINYTVTNTGITVDGNNIKIPVQFSVDGGTTWTDDLADVTANSNTQLDYAGGTTTTKTITVLWKWDFERGTDAEKAANNANDTLLGIEAAKLNTEVVLTVQAEITVTQVD